MKKLPFYIRVKVKANQKKESMICLADDRFEIHIKQKPERGEANRRIIQIFDDHFKNPEGGVRIINGHHTRTKLLKIGK